MSNQYHVVWFGGGLDYGKASFSTLKKAREYVNKLSTLEESDPIWYHIFKGEEIEI